MTDKPQKWFDSENLDMEEHQNLPLKAIHKKITKKHENLSKGLREYHESLVENKSKFLGWAKPIKVDQSIKTAQLLTSTTNLANSKAELAIKKIFKTDQKDAIGSAVQALDYNSEANLFAYGGLDKVLKLLRPNADIPKGYDLVSSIFFEGLPIVNSSFANKDSLMLTYFNKKFVSLYDISTQKSIHFYKLFNTDFQPKKTIVNRSGLAVISNTKELVLFDTGKNVSTQKAMQSDTVKDICYVNDTDIAASYETDSIKIFDIRVSLNRPKHVIKKAVDAISSNGKYLVAGNRNGIVQLFDVAADYNNSKTYDNITTEISSINLNDRYLTFASRWKNNSIRVVDLRDFSVFSTWPNIKTRLDVINRVIINDKDQLVCGTAKGSLDAYQLSLVQ